ncbi:unnamed protein product [Lasius platythorax]|uniref:Uncharacterized protein n=1 Tax=Lasius platythorax TaxID=488582 RepID=A0AAV2P6U8_9HYME
MFARVRIVNSSADSRICQQRSSARHIRDRRSRGGDKKVAAIWRATLGTLKFLDEMVPVDGGHPWWGLLFGWASLGRYRVAWFADEGTTG